jgi:hypothetical protein
VVGGLVMDKWLQQNGQKLVLYASWSKSSSSLLVLLKNA